MIRLHDEIAEQAAIDAHVAAAAAQAEMDHCVELLATRVPLLIGDAGLRWALHEADITLPSGQVLRFRASLQVVE